MFLRKTPSLPMFMGAGRCSAQGEIDNFGPTDQSSSSAAGLQEFSDAQRFSCCHGNLKVIPGTWPELIV